MKKNISINISGIIFHIEEDGYERLKSYLESINNYFSALDDSGEIVSDIESRIAEIFLSKLKDGKQVINAQDVAELINTMGSVEDFEAEGVEDEEILEKEKEKERSVPPFTEPEAPKKLYRDMARRLLGGVCSGIAVYFNIDPMWIRLLFIALFFDIFFSGTVGSLVLVCYIILWIVVPPSYTLEYATKYKKMFRDPERRVLGGVASGVAAYFGVEANLVRLLFVLATLFGFAGFVIYLILWIITPEARTLTDRMEMQGEPVTLTNIESNIKKSLNVRDGEEESPLVKILLFPFRLIALLLDAMGKALGPLLQFLGEFIRIILGASISLTGLAILVSMVVVTIYMFNELPLPGHTNIRFDNIPIQLFRDTVPTLTTISGFFSIAIPALVMILLGLTIVLKRHLLRTKAGLTLASLWIVSLVIFGFSFVPLATEFQSEGVHKVTQRYEMSGDTVVLDLNRIDAVDYEAVRLQLEGYPGNQVELEQRFIAYGESYKNAAENAKQTVYQVEQQDSILLFDSNLTIEEGTPFRGQHLRMRLYMPFYKPFMMKEDLAVILHRTMGRYNVRRSSMNRNIWIFTPEGLECLSCQSYQDQEYYSEAKRSKQETDIYSLPDDFEPKGTQKVIDLRDFNGLEVEDQIQVNIQEGSDYKVVINGERSWVQHTEVTKNGRELQISLEDTENLSKGEEFPVRVNITLPDLKVLELKNKTKGLVRGFDGEELRLKVRNEAYADVAVNAREVMVDMSGNAVIRLSGQAKYLIADLAGNSNLQSYDFKSRIADMELSGNANAQVDVQNQLRVVNSGNSSVSYHGHPRLELSGKSGNVRRE